MRVYINPHARAKPRCAWFGLEDSSLISSPARERGRSHFGIVDTERLSCNSLSNPDTCPLGRAQGRRHVDRKLQLRFDRLLRVRIRARLNTPPGLEDHFRNEPFLGPKRCPTGYLRSGDCFWMASLIIRLRPGHQPGRLVQSLKASSRMPSVCVTFWIDRPCPPSQRSSVTTVGGPTSRGTCCGLPGHHRRRL